MWQRIQTVYMAVVAILFGVMLTTPIVGFSDASANYVLNYAGVVSVGNEPTLVLNTMFLTVVELIIALVALVSIFLYKKRMLQVRLSIFNTILMIGYYFLLAMYIYIVTSNTEMQFSLRLPIVFPLIGAILTYLAIRAIGKDEALIRSLNRIR